MKKSGILMHVSSLPSPYGIGTMGEEAYNFVDFIKKSNSSIWQVLPIGQTSYGDSPYQSVSSFAGNPYFIDLDTLVREGLLEECDLPEKQIDRSFVDFGNLYIERYATLRKSYKKSFKSVEKEVEKLEKKYSWIADYSLFMAIKDNFGGKSWQEWEDEDARLRKEDTIIKYKKELKEEIDFYCYLQYLFFKQWKKLRRYANDQGIKICGDIPIYCALDSADVWANQDCFQLDQRKKPTRVAGVPPDYFSEDGQLWGNPLYDWDYLKETNYKFWVERMKATAELFDIVRVDHFIGFANYFSIDAQATTAREGVWVEGPKYSLFDCIKKEVPELDIIAEDLGKINAEVVALKEHYNYPGMHIITFMFDPEEEIETKGFEMAENSIVYTGTHDNDTTLSWWESQTEETKEFILKKISKDSDENIVEDLIEICFSSDSNIAIIPIQDYLKMGGEFRMNTPGKADGNWQARVKKADISDALAERIAKLNDKHTRSANL